MSNESPAPAAQDGELIPDERALFEAWYAKDDSSLRSVERSGPGYKLMQAQLSWTAWQAALASRSQVAPPFSEQAADEHEALDDLRRAVNEGADDEWLLGFVRGYPFNRAAQPLPVSGAPKVQAEPITLTDWNCAQANCQCLGDTPDQRSTCMSWRATPPDAPTLAPKG